MVLSSAPAPPPPDPVPSWQKPSADTRLSSDEGEMELSEESEKLLCHYSPNHPRAMSCCAFSSRLMGRGHYVFDRRWDRVRLALHCMVEKHVNSLMWRKVPLAVESASEVSPLSSAFLSAPLDGVSMLSFSHNGAGVFCIRDPEPGPRQQRNKPAKNQKASAETPKKRKNGNSYDFPAHISNGTMALSSRAKRVQDPTGVPSLSVLPFGGSDGRKRKSSGSSTGSDKPSKTTKSTALDGIFRKSSSVLLAAVAETPQNTLSRQARVPH